MICIIYQKSSGFISNYVSCRSGCHDCSLDHILSVLVYRRYDRIVRLRLGFRLDGRLLACLMDRYFG